MSSKTIVSRDAARRRIEVGVDVLSNVVKVTLGPRGRNVVLENAGRQPTITKDGATVAQHVELAERFANLGAQMVKEVAQKTSESVGDGTTTATVLAQAIYKEGLKVVTAGASPMDVKRGIDQAVVKVVAHLARQSQATRNQAEIVQVGTISSNGDRAIGELIAEAIERVGRDGMVTLDEGQTTQTTLTVVEGLRFDRGYLSPYFITDPERMEAVLEDALVLVHERKVSSLRELVPLLEQVAGAGRPLLIVGEIDGEALSTLVVNKLRGTLRVCAVKPPGFGTRRADALKDLAVLVGGRAITEDLGMKLENVTLKDLGRVRKVVVDRKDTTLIEGGGVKEEVATRIQQVRSQISEAKSELDRDGLKERLSKLTQGVAVIHVGAVTESELKEKKARIEDALAATRAAIEEGIVPGGGAALVHARRALLNVELPGDEQFGVNLLRRALEQPLRQIAENAGKDGAVVVGRVANEKSPFGYDAAADEYGDLIALGVVDPTKVVRVALENAASLAALLLTTEVLIAEHQESVPQDHDGMVS